MNVKAFFLGRDVANCYALDDGENVVIIDPGAFCGHLAEYAAENRGRLRLAICTHGHFDHICGLYELKEACPELKICVSEADAGMLCDPALSLAAEFGCEQRGVEADILLNDGQTVGIGGVRLNVMATPGHTPGSITLWDDEYAFTGDTLFRGSIGRCDFYNGDFGAMEDSLRRLKRFYNEMGNRKVLSGHGLRTTLEREAACNPYMAGL